jgi:hypothetical protein
LLQVSLLIWFSEVYPYSFGYANPSR